MIKQVSHPSVRQADRQLVSQWTIQSVNQSCTLNLIKDQLTFSIVVCVAARFLSFSRRRDRTRERAKERAWHSSTYFVNNYCAHLLYRPAGWLSKHVYKLNCQVQYVASYHMTDIISSFGFSSVTAVALLWESYTLLQRRPFLALIWSSLCISIFQTSLSFKRTTTDAIVGSHIIMKRKRIYEHYLLLADFIKFVLGVYEKWCTGR